ncbi:heme-dependent oxidative N-demethylase family protein [Oceanibacterium hippocampi]|uniref:heme-dependent oxidative N-demethylase family protein n=1 Tax=Oceanibacterium hippocampi TaxID=745714 RepID=UPI000A26E32C|nr:DUF3445 domain-containing protein [Oceanibacterium hippocampi]
MAPPYFPVGSGAYRMTMGLHTLPPEDWIEIDDDLGRDLAEKARLDARDQDAVFAETAGSAAAQREVLEMLFRHLPARFPEIYLLEGEQLVNRLTGAATGLGAHPALLAAGHLVQEDLCLMEERDGAFLLTAASLSFPTRWTLREKIGRSFDAIHEPVPGFNGVFSGPSAAVMGRLAPERSVWRLNWTLLDDPALHLPEGHGGDALNPAITPDNAGDKLIFRVERQTLRRLPESRAILFTIRIHRTPLRAFSDRPDQAAALASALRTMPEDLARYKSLPGIRDAALAWLDRVSAAA